MKKFLFLFAILTSTFLQAQSLPITTVNNIKVNNPVLGATTDSVLVWRGSGDKIVRFVPASSIGGLGTLQNLQSVLEQGSTASINTPLIVTYNDAPNTSVLYLSADVAKLAYNTNYVEVNENFVNINSTVRGFDAIESNEFVTKSQLDADISAQTLQAVTDNGATTTNAITTGGLTIPVNSLNITGGNSNYYLKENGKSGIFVSDVRTSTMGTDTTGGSTTPISINSQIATAIYRLQNMINATAANAIPLSGTEVGSPVTGDIEFTGSAGRLGVLDDVVSISSNDNSRSVSPNGIYATIGGVTTGLFNTGDAILIKSDSTTSLGLYSTTDFTSNITDLAYVQKKYVDDNFMSLTGNTFSTGITGDVYHVSDNPRIYLTRSNNGGTIEQTSTSLNITASAFGGKNKIKLNASELELNVSGGLPMSFTHDAYSNTLPNDTGTIALSNGSQDIEITNFAKGVILKSPDGTRWRITVDNTGALVTTSLPTPK